MPRRLDIGIASYGASEKLIHTLHSLRSTCHTDWRCFVIYNPGPDPRTREVIANFAKEEPRIVTILLPTNIGYAGAVNKLFELAETEYIAYSDNDVVHQKHSWDEEMARKLDQFHEIGMLFPQGGAAPIPRGQYTEIMWGIGCSWMLNRLCLSDVGPFDTSLGHQEEADYCLRVRMAGWKCASLSIPIQHDCSATTSPASTERINRGVVAWVNKWCAYFGGKNLNYHSPNVLRWEDWPPNALYLEEYWKRELGDINSSPETLTHAGREYDYIRVPRYSGYYRNRII